MIRRRYVVLACAAALALVTAACSSSSSSSTSAAAGSTSTTTSSSSEGGGTVNATEHDFEIALDQTTVAGGEVTFNITNNGPSTHEFVVFKSDDAPDDLPVENGEVQEDELDAIGEQEDIAPNTNSTLTLQLPAGQYVIICNITGHYEAGMQTGLTVS